MDATLWIAIAWALAVYAVGAIVGCAMSERHARRHRGDKPDGDGGEEAGLR